MPPVRRPLALVVALFVAAATRGAPPGSTDTVVREAAGDLYIHGMTQEIADQRVGKAGVPALLRLLAEPDFSRRDNVVAFLAYLGGPETTPALLRLLAAPPATTTAEDVRALLLVPHALGRIAGRGEPSSLGALLAMTADGSGGGPIADAPRHHAFPRALGDDLVAESVAGLAFTRAASARERLNAIARGRVVPMPGRPALAAKAREALALMDEASGRGSGPKRGNGASSASPVSTPGATDGASSVAGAVVTPAYVPDPSTISDQHGLSFLNHVSVATPMDAVRLDQVLTESTKRAATGDYDGDVPCCLVVSRSGSGGTFGTAGDGLAVIDNGSELDTVLQTPGGRVKVVNAINYCGSAGTNIIGCAYQGSWGMSLVRMSGLNYEAVLWIHEYGHNNGLGHATSDSRLIMYGTDNGANNGLSPGDCAAFHNPPAATKANKISIGACTNDGDAIADPIDNCPLVANQDQADANHNGIGDACEACPTTGDTDGDGICNPVDNCPTVSNPGQADFDQDGIGDACETGALLADVDLSGRVDGYDLSLIGLAFGSSAGDPRYDKTCDLDRNGVVDGSDVALFSAQFGKKSR